MDTACSASNIAIAMAKGTAAIEVNIAASVMAKTVAQSCFVGVAGS